MPKRLFAGVIPNTTIAAATIYDGPDDAPIADPLNYINRVYFDTRFDYMHVVKTIQVSKDFVKEDVTQSCGKKGKNCADIPRQGTRDHNLGAHGQTYKPAVLLYDTGSNKAITGTTFIQIVSNNSFRVCSVRVDSSNIYLKEKWFVRSNNLTAISKNFKIDILNKPAE
jgi:hypothetical protein